MTGTPAAPDAASGILEEAVAAEHDHWFHALWVHLGPFGRQDIHYHPCVEDEDEPWSCTAVLVGYGRECNGSAQRHVRSGLPLPADLAVPGEPEASRVPANPASGTAEAAWQAWYEPEHDIGRFMSTPPYDKMREAFAAGFEAAASRSLVLVWRDERSEEIARCPRLHPGTERIAIPLSAQHCDLLREDGGND
jgi:hypothetical protein